MWHGRELKAVKGVFMCIEYADFGLTLPSVC
jgi:hypothetical protein